MELHANSSNNTVYADADGHIAYFHPQFVPEAGRQVRLDPAGGRQRSGDRVARRARRRGQPARRGSAQRMDPEHQRLAVLGGGARTAPSGTTSPGTWTPAGESPRGLHAIRVLEGRKDFTLDRLRDAAFDSYLTAFARLLPPLLAAYDSTPDGDSLKARLAEPIAALRAWDYRWSARLGGDVARRVLGRRAHGVAAGTDERGRPGGLRLHGDARTHGEQDFGALAAAVGPARRATSAPGGRRGARSTDSSGSPATSCSRSTMRGRASRCRSPRRGGARSRRSARAHTPARSGCTAPAATVSSRWSSSEGQRAGASDNRRRRERRSGVEALRRPGAAVRGRAIFGRSTSTLGSSRGTRSGSITQAPAARDEVWVPA